MAKQMMFEQEAREGIQRGVSKLAAAVKITLGPVGRNVVLQKSYGSPRITKDGVTVSKEIELPEPFENMGTKMMNEVARKTSDVAGDGTTTATVLAEAIYNEGLRNVVAGANPMALKRGIEAATGAVVQFIKDQSVKVRGSEEIAQVGTISANGDAAIGKLLAETIEQVGPEGVIEIEEGKSFENEKEVVEGMQFDKGYISPYFMTDPNSMECVLEDPIILIHEKKVSSLQEFLPLLDKVAGGGKPILVIAEDVESDALAALVVNRLRGVLHCCAVKAPGFGDRRKAMLGDIAVVTGGRLISEDLGIKLENIEFSDLGKARKVVVGKEKTTIVGGGGKKSEITARCDQIRTQIDKTTSDYDREKLQERLAKLSGGVAVIRVGGGTEVEVKERKDLVDDAFHATKAAVEEGVVAGGGTIFIRAVDAIQNTRNRLKGDEKIGFDIVAKALEAPARQIAENAGLDGAIVVDQIKSKSGKWGFDVNAGELTDMFKAGILDPAKVVRSALEHAASVAGLMLTTDVLVTDLKDEDEKIAGAVR